MKTANIPDYAAAVLGFDIDVGDKLVMLEEIVDSDDHGMVIKIPKGATAVVRGLSLEPMPSQLSITLEIFLEGETGESVFQVFTEDDLEPQFPFDVPKTQEDIEFERAEAATRAEEQAKKAAQAQAEKEEKEEIWQSHYHGRGYH